MKKRNIAFVMIMSIITLGFYTLYWLIDTRRELIKKGYKIPSIFIVLWPFIGIVLMAVLSLFEGPKDKVTSLLTGPAWAALFIAFIWLWIYWTSKYCQAVEKATRGSLSSGFNLALAILLNLFGVYFIWPGIVQYHLNKVGRR